MTQLFRTWNNGRETDGKLTWSFQAERDGSGFLPVLPTLGLLSCDFDGIRVYFVQTLAENLVEAEKQIPVIVNKEERVYIVLKTK
jgi:hypothetical protein